MLRRLINVATGASVLLTAAICILWWHSYDRSDKITWSQDSGLSMLRSAPGRAVLYVFRADHWGRPGDMRGFQYTRDAAASPELEMFSVLLLCYDPSAEL